MLAIVEKQLVVWTFCTHFEGPLLAIYIVAILVSSQIRWNKKGRQHTRECFICSSHTLLAILHPTKVEQGDIRYLCTSFSIFIHFPTQTPVKEPTPRVSWLITTHLSSTTSAASVGDHRKSDLSLWPKSLQSGCQSTFAWVFHQIWSPPMVEILFFGWN